MKTSRRAKKPKVATTAGPNAHDGSSQEVQKPSKKPKAAAVEEASMDGERKEGQRLLESVPVGAGAN